MARAIASVSPSNEDAVRNRVTSVARGHLRNGVVARHEDACATVSEQHEPPSKNCCAIAIELLTPVSCSVPRVSSSGPSRNLQ